MTDSSRVETQWSAGSRKRPSELLRTYASDPRSPQPDEIQRLLSELDARQAELEVQNQKLQETQRQLEAYRDRYVDLYDFAPLGYVTLDEDGYIQEINLAGAKLLGGEVAEFVGYPFTDCVAATDRDTFVEHIRKCCGQHQEMTSELGLIGKDGRSIAVQFHSVPVVRIEHEGTFCKTAITDITDRQRNEEALRNSEEQLRMVMRASGTGWWVWDLRTNALKLDDQSKLLLGVPSSAEVTYDLVREHLRWEDRARLDQTLASTLAEPGEHEVECAVDWPDGSVHWALLRGCAFHDAAGRPLRVMGVAVDITGRRRAEKAIRESEQFYRTLIETLPVTVVLASPQGRAVYISPAAKEMFGVSPGEGLGTVPTDWIAPEHHAVVLERVRKVMVELRPQPPIEYRMFKRDRTPLWAQVTSAPVLDSEGHLAGVVTVCQNVTAIKQAEEALRENEARLRLAQQAARAGAWDLNLSTGRGVVSEETWQLWGVAPREAPESFDWLAAVHPDDCPLVQAAMRQAMQQPGESRCEYRIVWPDGQVRWHHARGRTLTDSAGQPTRLIGITTDVTERKHAEQRLRESDDRLRLAIRGAEMGWWDWDLLSGEMTVDDQCKTLWGVPLTTRPGYELTIELTHPDDRAILQQRLQEVLEAPEERDVEIRAVWPNGTIRWLLIRGRAFRDDRGKPVHVMGLVMDVTARKQAEQALRESETRFRAIYEQAPLGIALIDSLTGHFLQINPKYREIIGRSEEEMRKLTFQSITHPDDLQADLDNMARLIEGKSRFFNMEKRLFRGDGSLIWVNLTVVPMWEEGQLPQRHIAIIEDISERRRAEDALRESQERLRLALESAELGWWSWDFAAGAIEGDQKTRSLLGSAEATVPFEGILELTHPDDRSELRERAIELQSQTGNHEVEFRVVWPDGSIHWVSARGQSFANVEGKPVRAVGITMDITERKRAEEDVAASKASAEQANRAKDHFLAVLSHELRTPLTPVLMGVSMLQGRPDLDPDLRKTLEMVRRNAEMEARLIDDLLDVTRIARGKIELTRSVVELCTVIRRAIEVCQPDIDARKLHFGVDWGPAWPYWVEADVTRLEQVFWNLLRNAIKFTPHGGCVGIRCRPDGAHVVVEVNDSGMGIEADALPRVFNAFEQVEQSITRRFGGLGLGLAISKTLVEMHGGQIEAHSAGRGEGATFRIRLLLTAPAGKPESPAPVVSPQRGLRRLRILLVEDHGVTAKMMQMLLTADGHTVETAGDVASALELADLHDFDLLVSDLGLPDGSGHDLMHQVCQRGHKFPGIALSGYGQEEDVRRSYEAGFAIHLTKPVSRERLIEAVASASTRQPAPGSTPGALGFEGGRAEPVAASDVFDLNEAIHHCADDREMFQAMVGFFFDEADPTIEQLRAALATQDAASAARVAHRFKGTVGYLGSTGATEATRLVEQAGTSGDLSSAANLMDDLVRQVQLLKKALEPYRRVATRQG